jgi:hypothetical protein|tara:strand:+ start:29 stop:664 length:636 start_codon:yes stop_codon:yes gene_type:complete
MTLKTLTGSIFLLLILSSNVHARNDYLNDGFYTCRQGDVRVELGYTDTTNPYGSVYPNSTNSNYNHYSDRYDRSARISYTWFLGSNCTDENQAIITENMMLKQQIELMKVCRRYGGRELPPQFSMLEKKCRGITKDDNTRPGFKSLGGTRSLYDEMIDDYKEKNPESLINKKDSKYGNAEKFEFTGEEGVKQDRKKTIIELKKQMEVIPID